MSSSKRARRQWRAPVAPLADWAQFDVSRPEHRAALLAADPDRLWSAGFVVLAQALDPTTEFRFTDPTLTFRQVCEAAELRRALGLPDA